MRHSRYVSHSPSVSSSASTQQSSSNKLKSPVPSDYEYVGRLVTRERPIVQKSKSAHQNSVFPQTKHQYHHVARSNHQPVYEEASCSSSGGDDADEIDSLSKPLGVIRINDRHLREIYRLPTPPPKVKRVYHRLRSPETKVIERVFVRRPPPQIIENIIEVPPEKVRIINREKILGKSKPITRSKLIRLKAQQHDRGVDQQIIEEGDEGEQQQQQETQPIFAPTQAYAQSQSQQQQTTQPILTHVQSYPQSQPQQITCNPSGGCYPQQAAASTVTNAYIPQQPIQTTTVSFNPPHQPVTTTTTTAMVYPSQTHTHGPGCFHATMPSNAMFNSQQTLRIPTPQVPQGSPYTFVPQQVANHQMITPSTPYAYVPQQTAPVMSYGNARY
ncbi:unnamed protein product [Adineta ricciae]|uniref:Uncharacterized protein n=1 Tax=Adineta ricciae TaxID=249248 RepID=A0A814H4Z6_ADIRI|nr:unnamed protein product [Adineta ricciae]